MFAKKIQVMNYLQDYASNANSVMRGKYSQDQSNEINHIKQVIQETINWTKENKDAELEAKGI